MKKEESKQTREESKETRDNTKSGSDSDEVPNPYAEEGVQIEEMKVPSSGSDSVG